MMIIFSAIAAVLCVGIVAQLAYEDFHARQELRRSAYIPRHALPGEDTIGIPIAAVEAVLAERIEVSAR